MSTKHRIIENESIHHVYSRGAKKLNIFHMPADYIWFLNKVFYLQTEEKVEILNFCLLPNHFHFVIKEGAGEKSPYFHSHLSRFFHRLLSAYVQHYAHRYSDGSGCLFQSEFQSVEITGKRHYRTVMKYVDQNPVAAGLVEKPQHWPWCAKGMGW